MYFCNMQCFLHSDLMDDRPTTAQFRDKLPWFLRALPSASCAKGGHGAYTNSVDLQGWLRLLFLEFRGNRIEKTRTFILLAFNYLF